MTGIVKKIDAQGFGIIDGADGSKVPFIRSDVMNRHILEPGQKVIFSVRRVKDQAFAENVVVMREQHNWWRCVTQAANRPKRCPLIYGITPCSPQLTVRPWNSTPTQKRSPAVGKQ